MTIILGTGQDKIGKLVHDYKQLSNLLCVFLKFLRRALRKEGVRLCLCRYLQILSLSSLGMVAAAAECEIRQSSSSTRELCTEIMAAIGNERRTVVKPSSTPGVHGVSSSRST